ncbi:MAG: serine/threonine-protein kinase [Ktedonobacterales bacterium]
MTTLEDRRTRTAPTSGLLARRYELGQPLAHGGMATLWRGWDRRLCRAVAIKTLREDDLADESAYTRLRREALVSAAVTHPHIVEVHDLIEEDGVPYLILELVEGEDLKQRIHQRGALDPFDALAVARQTCLALAAAHERGIIHRDVKPHNILLTSDLHAKLTDFGLALSPLDTTPEQKDIVFGTPEYMAPEQAMGARIGVQTDLYGLGVTLYEALSGDAPFRGPSAEETMKQHISAPITPLRALRPDVPEPIEEVVMCALEKEPGARYRDASEMEQALAGAAAEAHDMRSVFAAPEWPQAAAPAFAMSAPLGARMVYAAGARQYQARRAGRPARLPDAFWVRLLWVVFALNIMLAVTLLCVFVLHLAM